MNVTCIDSGSRNGNCWIVEFDNGQRIILDAGVNPNRISRRMGHDIVGLPVFITHEHGDHAYHSKRFSDDYGCVLYATKGTLDMIQSRKGKLWTQALGYEETEVNDELTVTAIPVIHNAMEPCGFHFKAGYESLIYITDAGMPPDYQPDELTALIIEANYTPERLERQASMMHDDDPMLSVQARVSSGIGHLSNEDAFNFAYELLGELQLLILTHMSERNFSITEHNNSKTTSSLFKQKARLAMAGETYTTRKGVRLLRKTLSDSMERTIQASIDAERAAVKRFFGNGV